MVSKKKVLENEDKEQINNSLSDTLQKASMHTSERADIDSRLNKNMRHVQVKVYSDMEDGAGITTWDDAVNYYNQIRGKRSPDDKARYGLPIKMYLLPAKLLGSIQYTPIKELSETVAEISVKMIQNLHTAIRKASDLENKTKYFPILQHKIKIFQNLVEMYKTTFQKNVFTVLLQDVRGGQREENVLHEAIKKHAGSPFGNLEKWLNDIRTESHALLRIKNKMTNSCNFVEDKNFEQNVTRKMNNFVFTLQVCSREGIFLDNMVKYYTSISTEKCESNSHQKRFQINTFKNNASNLAHSIMTNIGKYYPSITTKVEQFEPDSGQKWFRNERFFKKSNKHGFQNDGSSS